MPEAMRTPDMSEQQRDIDDLIGVIESQNGILRYSVNRRDQANAILERFEKIAGPGSLTVEERPARDGFDLVVDSSTAEGREVIQRIELAKRRAEKVSLSNRT